MAKHPPCPTRRVPLDHRGGPHRARPGDAPAGAAEPLGARRARRADRRRYRRLGRRLAGHARPREPRAAVARRSTLLRDATERAGKTLAPRLTVYPEYVRDARALAASRRALRGAVRSPTLEGLARDDDWAAGGEDGPSDAPPGTGRAPRAVRRRVTRRRGARRRAAGEEVGVDEIVTLLGARGPDVARVSPRSPTSSAPTPSATSSRSCGTATSTTRTSARSSASSARSRRARCRSTSAATPYLLDLEEIQRRVVEAVECGATEVCLQGGIHPDFDGEYYLSVARAVKEAAPHHPRARVHRARGHRGRPPPRHAAARLPRARQGRRARDVARHRGRDPRRRGAGDHLPRQGQHRGVARGPPHSRTRSGCARTSRSCSARSSGRCTSPATSCARGRSRRRPAGSPSSCRCRSCTWPARSSSSRRSRRGPDHARGAAHARGRPHRLPRLDRQRAGLVGEGRRRRRAPGAARRVQRPRRHADGREHLARRGREPRPGARRRRLPRASSSRSVARSSSAPRSTAGSPRWAGGSGRAEPTSGRGRRRAA